MKKYLPIVLLVVFITPSIAFASWWNPFTWKIFHKKEVAPQTQLATDKTIEQNSGDLSKVQSKSVPAIEPKLNKEQQIISKIPPSVFVDNNIGVRCKLYMQGDVNIGEPVRAELSDLNIGISKYDVIWDKNNLKKLTYFNEATFAFDTPGNKIISALVVRKADGAQKKIDCTEIVVENLNTEQPEISSTPTMAEQCKNIVLRIREKESTMRTIEAKYLELITRAELNESGALRGGVDSTITNIRKAKYLEIAPVEFERDILNQEYIRTCNY